MSRKLTDVDVQFLSLVKKGANGEKVTVYKSADFEEILPEETKEVTITKEDMGVIEKTLAKLKKFVVGGEKEDAIVAKAKDIDTKVDYTSFNSRINSVTNNWWKALDALESVGYEIFWSDVENGQDLLTKAIDEFKAHISSIVSAKVKKEDIQEYFAKQVDLVTIAKTDTLEALKTLQKSLNDSISSLENLEKGVDDEVKKEEFEALLTPIVKSIEGLSEKVSALETQEPVTKEDIQETVDQKTEETQENLIEEVTKSLEPIVKSLEGISQRLTAIEETRGISKQGDGEVNVEKGAGDDDWDGVLFVD